MGYNPWNKRPPCLPERTRTFDLKSGDRIELTLRKLGTVEQMHVYELSRTLIQRYVKGDDEFVDSNGKSGDGPIPFPPVGGNIVQPTENMVQAAAFLQIMQQGEPDSWIDAERWIAFQVVEDTADWQAIQRFVREVNALGKPDDPIEADVPNGSGADTRDSSDRPSLTLADTPN